MKFTTNRRLFVLITVVLIGLITIAVWRINQKTLVVSASRPANLSESILLSKALSEAQITGMKGNPTAKKAVFMTWNEWLTLVGAEIGSGSAMVGLSADTPVYVLAMRGDVEWGMPSQPNPNDPNAGKEKEKFDNLTLVLNAQTGDVIWTLASPPNIPLPVEIP